MGKWVHRISNVNLEDKTALCSNCGVVGFKIKRSSSGLVSYACRERVRQSDYRTESKRRAIKYGLSEREYRQMLTDQNYLCAICNLSEPLAVDHSHDTGQVRGLLCRNCNIGIGMFKDSPALLGSAQRYLTA